MTKTLLMVAHCPSENTRKLWNSINSGVSSINLNNTIFKALSPFETHPKDVINADAIILGTTENLGYMSGALKDFFDRCYYPCLDLKQGLPCAAFIRAGQDGTGTKKALETVTTGLKWRWVQPPLILKGNYQTSFEKQCLELGATMACALDEGII